MEQHTTAHDEAYWDTAWSLACLVILGLVEKQRQFFQNEYYLWAKQSKQGRSHLAITLSPFVFLDLIRRSMRVLEGINSDQASKEICREYSSAAADAATVVFYS